MSAFANKCLCINTTGKHEQLQVFNNRGFIYDQKLYNWFVIATKQKNMDFLDPAKRQAHIRRLFLGYFLVGIAIALASTIIVILSNGYDVDRKTGKVIQNGLIFTDSAPESSTIFLNGKENGQTDKRLTVPAGKYDLELRRTGYDTWKKSFQLDGGSIERFIYPRLFPTKLVVAETKKYDSRPIFSSQSPDRRWIMVSVPGSLADFEVYDTENTQDAPKAIALEASLLTNADTGKHKLKLVEWSTDNRHLLIRHSFDDKFEYIVIDRAKPEESINVNKTLKVDPTLVTLRDKKFDKLYLYDEKTKLLQTADTKSKKITDIIKSVSEYKSYQDDTVIYTVNDPKSPETTQVRVWKDNKNYLLRTIKSSPVLIDMAKFDTATYIAIAPVKENRMLIFKDPIGKLGKSSEELAPLTLMKINKPEKISFSNNTRFLAAESGTTFAVYDFEDSRRFNFEVPGKIDESGQLATWMDGHRLLLNQDSKILVFEFDGANYRDLGSVVSGTIPAFDRDYERLFSFAPIKDSKGVYLVRTSLKLNLKP